MQNLIFFENNSIYMNSGMNEESFSRIKYSQRIKTDKGVIASKENSKWNFAPWVFEETTFYGETKNVFFKGEAFHGKTLASSFDDKDSIKTVLEVLEAAVETKAPLQNIGAEGIIISDDKTNILFIPQEFFYTASTYLEEEDSALANGFYINRNLSRECAIRFTQAVIIYKFLADKFPYEAKNQRERTEDQRDKNFIPLKELISNCSSSVLKFTQKALSGKDCIFPSEKVFAEIEKSNTLINTTASNQPVKFSIRAKRWARKHSVAITTSTAAIVLSTFIATSLYKTRQEKSVSVGLTSKETVEMFYSAVNMMDSESMGNCSGKKIRPRVKLISNTFAVSKMNSRDNRTVETLSPAEWISEAKINTLIFGISNFYIEEENSKLYFKGPKRKTNPSPLKTENGKIVKDGDTNSYRVSYFILETSGSDNLKIDHQSEIVKLIFKKDHWSIEEIENISTDVKEMKLSEFRDSYTQALTQTKANLPVAVEMLREKYNFIPTVKEIVEAVKFTESKQIFDPKDFENLN